MKTNILLFVFSLLSISLHAQKPELVVPIGHTSSIESAVFSPDAKYIATASTDKTAKIWESTTGKLLHSLEGHTLLLQSAAFSPDGKYILTSSLDNSAEIWESVTGKRLHTLKGLTSTMTSAQFSTDGKYVVCTGDNIPRIWETATGKFVDSLKGHTSYVGAAQFSADGKYIVTASWDSTARIWDSATGKLLHTLQGHRSYVTSAQFSPDGKYIVTASKDSTAKIWESATGKLLHNLKGHTYEVKSAKFSPDGKDIITITAGGGSVIPESKNKIVMTATGDGAKLWESTTGKLLQSLGGNICIGSAEFSSDSRYIVTTSRGTITFDNNKLLSSSGGETTIWENPTGKLIRNLERPIFWDNSARFSPDGRSIVTAGGEGVARIYESSTGRRLHNMNGHTSQVSSAKFSPDLKYIVTASNNNSVRLWERATGKMLQVQIGDASAITATSSAQFSPDGKYFLTACSDIVKIWESGSNKLLRSLEVNALLKTAKFSPDGKCIATLSSTFGGSGFGDGIIKIWETSTGILLQTLEGNSNWPWASPLQFSPDSKYIVIVSSDSSAVKIWETATGKLLHNLKGHKSYVRSAEFSPDGKYIITASWDGTAKVWESSTGMLHLTSEKHFGGVEFAVFSPDGNYIVTASRLDSLKIWESSTGKLLHTLAGHNGQVGAAQSLVTFLQISPDGKCIISASQNGTTQFWETETGNLIRTIQLNNAQIADINFQQNLLIATYNSNAKLIDYTTGKELLTYIAIDSSDWVVLHPSGLFDASPGAMKEMYYVQGNDVIEFDQLKERYYEPGLWKKVMSGEKLRDVTGMNQPLELSPDINLGYINNDGKLNINLINKGGGIGKVKIFINGKEIAADARGGVVTGNKDSVSLSYSIINNPCLLPGKENEIEVKAYNGDNSIISRGIKVTYTPEKAKTIEAPNLYIVSCGVSDYVGSALTLKFAAKDADDMAKALQVGAKHLFGVEKTFTYLLSTNNKDSATQPTKQNIENTFEKIGTLAKSGDVIVVYLSGHGINWGGEEGDFYYLTKDAFSASADAYNDAAIRNKTTISSTELTELIKKVPALKQVLIIDACASGKMVDKMMAQRDISSSTVRALEKLKDRTGMHIITGCAADAVSFEASRFGQGVLTYSLIQGIKGAALEDGKFVDVVTLLQYAQNIVPDLAKGIGGIQEPKTFDPDGAQSFAIGELNEEEKKSIPLAKAKPMFIRTTFMNTDQFEDDLSLGKAVDNLLQEQSAKGVDGKWVFVDVKEFPEAIQLSGGYKKDGNIYTMQLKLKSSDGSEVVSVKGKDKDELVAAISNLLDSKASGF